ncbi:porin family protein [Ningiella sp. W23]|uniref:porin family protein n=1 Tax=Ningiella sp. W23 TaxID=3023715 RepID=UPI0037575D91
MKQITRTKLLSTFTFKSGGLSAIFALGLASMPVQAASPLIAAQSSSAQAAQQTQMKRDEKQFYVNKSKCSDLDENRRSNQSKQDDDCAFEYFYVSGFIGAGFGENEIDVQSAANDIGFDVFDIEEDYDGLALKLLVGASFTENLSFELGYTRLADAEVAFSTNTTDPDLFFDLARSVRPTSVDGFTGALVYSFVTDDEWYLYGRVGLFQWEGEYDSFDVFGERQLESLPSTDGTDIFFGIGATYRINNHLEANVEWERYRFDDADEDVLWLGLTYHFDDAMNE